ncbi:N-acetyltransferase family protein [Cupriavidus basilensis]
MRFFCMIRQPPHSQLARMTQIDYAREMAFVAASPGRQRAGGHPGRSKGRGRPRQPARRVRRDGAPDCKRQGIGGLLLRKMVARCRAHGTRELVGTTLATNTAMLRLAESSGIRVLHGARPGQRWRGTPPFADGANRWQRAMTFRHATAARKGLRWVKARPAHVIDTEWMRGGPRQRYPRAWPVLTGETRHEEGRPCARNSLHSWLCTLLARRLNENDSDYEELIALAKGRNFILLGEATHGHL